MNAEKTLLASAIDGVSRAITNRRRHPRAGRYLHEGRGFNLTLAGYDMEMGITTTIECNVLVPGETVLDAKLLSAMVNRMPAGDVCIELNDEGQAKISGGVAEFEIPALNASDYPSLPVTSTSSVVLQDAIINDYLPNLSAILLEEGIIQAPLTAVIRKGKERFVCDARLAERASLVQPSRKRQTNRLNIAAHILDMDHIPELSRYDRCRICVPTVLPARLLYALGLPLPAISARFHETRHPNLQSQLSSCRRIASARR